MGCLDVGSAYHSPGYRSREAPRREKANVANMNIGFSLFLIAVGAVLAWAVSAEVAGIDLKIVGVILMVVGLAGAALSLLFWSSFAPFPRNREVREVEVVETRPPTDPRR